MWLTMKNNTGTQQLFLSSEIENIYFKCKNLETAETDLFSISKI